MSFLPRIFVFLILALFPFNSASAQPFPSREEILDLKAEIVVNKDGSLDIEETIEVFALGRKIRRGIYRDFPTRYRGSDGSVVNVDFAVLGLERNGKREDYHVNRTSDGKRVYFGNKHRFFRSGIHTYKFRFSTSRQLNFSLDTTELYFNAIATGWEFPIRQAEVIVSLPASVPNKQIEFQAFIGEYGSVAADYQARLEGQTLRFKTNKVLSPGSGMTVVVKWPSGHVEEPRSLQKVGWLVKDNLGSVVGLLGGLLLSYFYYSTWSSVGKDPQKGTIVPLYDAPEDLSPWEARYLYKMFFDQKCLSTLITSLAVDGHLRIDDLSETNIGLLKGKSGPEPGIGNLIYSSLFQDRDDFRFILASQNHVGNLLSLLRREVEGKHLNKSFQKNWTQRFSGIILSALLVLVISFITAGFGGVDYLWLTIVSLIIAQCIFYTIFLGKRTHRGRKLMDGLEGYRLYLETAEKEVIERASSRELSKEVFEKHLPYAMALDIEDSWANAFNTALAQQGKAETYQPSWRTSNISNLNSFSSSFSSMSRTMSQSIAVAATPPATPSSGGGFSSGGGGFSGGGGGGGGGGGW